MVPKVVPTAPPSTPATGAITRGEICQCVGLRVVSQSDTEVMLSYPLYRKGDALCCPGGGQTKVRFQLNNGKLTALDPIPPLSRKAGPARY